MEREQLKELQYITHVVNMPSICSLGVLSNRRASKVGHKSVADPEVQDRRKRKRVPSGLLLHDYANLYVTARNPMLYKRIHEGQIDELCVVRVSTAVLNLDGVVVTDRNAAKFGCGFKSPSEGIDDIDGELLTRTYWRDGDALERDRCWNAKFTEVLVPDLVPPNYLQGIYTGTSVARSTLESLGLPLEISGNAVLFFNS
jgi:hypothetical protein